MSSNPAHVFEVAGAHAARAVITALQKRGVIHNDPANRAVRLDGLLSYEELDVIVEQASGGRR